ncbi:MAG: BA14K family protein [Rhizomicrobium sp.]
MRYPIETAPRNGNVVVLEDEASGTLEVAHWSPTGEWIGEYGEPSAITPSHWHPCYSYFQSPSTDDAPQPPTASDVIALPSAAAVEAQIAPSQPRRGFAIPWIAALVVTVVLVGIFTQQAVLHRYALEEERARSAALESELAKARRDTETTGVALSRNKRGDEVAQQAAERALWQSLQQQYDRAEALATELAQARRAMEQKPAALQERPAAKQSEHLSPENSKPEIKAVETVPPKRRAMSQDVGYGCQHYRTYDSASGTYVGYDGRRRSCRLPEPARGPGIALPRRPTPSPEANPDTTGSTNVAQPEDPVASGTPRQADVEPKPAETPKTPTGLIGWFGR